MYKCYLCLHSKAREDLVYKYKSQLPSPEDYNQLREKVGWGALDLELVIQSLPKSLYSICAFYKDQIIAFARIVGDGGLCFYIQEIIVDPNHQRNGIASKFMEYILDYFSKTAKKKLYKFFCRKKFRKIL